MGNVWLPYYHHNNTTCYRYKNSSFSRRTIRRVTTSTVAITIRSTSTIAITIRVISTGVNQHCRYISRSEILLLSFSLWFSCVLGMPLTITIILALVFALAIGLAVAMIFAVASNWWCLCHHGNFFYTDSVLSGFWDSLWKDSPAGYGTRSLN